MIGALLSLFGGILLVFGAILLISGGTILIGGIITLWGDFQLGQRLLTFGGILLTFGGVIINNIFRSHYQDAILKMGIIGAIYNEVEAMAMNGIEIPKDVTMPLLLLLLPINMSTRSYVRKFTT